MSTSTHNKAPPIPDCRPITVYPTLAPPIRSPRSPFCWTTVRVPLSTCRMAVTRNSTGDHTASIASANGGQLPGPCRPRPLERPHRRNSTIQITHSAPFIGRPQLLASHSTIGFSMAPLRPCIIPYLISTVPAAVGAEDVVFEFHRPRVAIGRALRHCLARKWKSTRSQRMYITRR